MQWLQHGPIFLWDMLSFGNIPPLSSSTPRKFPQKKHILQSGFLRFGQKLFTNYLSSLLTNRFHKELMSQERHLVSYLGILKSVFTGCMSKRGGSPSPSSIAVIPNDQTSHRASQEESYCCSQAMTYQTKAKHINHRHLRCPKRRLNHLSPLLVPLVTLILNSSDSKVCVIQTLFVCD